MRKHLLILVMLAVPSAALAGTAGVDLRVNGSDSVTLDVNALPTTLTLEAVLDSDTTVAGYQMQLQASADGLFSLSDESCYLLDKDFGQEPAFGSLAGPLGTMPGTTPSDYLVGVNLEPAEDPTPDDLPDTIVSWTLTVAATQTGTYTINFVVDPEGRQGTLLSDADAQNIAGAALSGLTVHIVDCDAPQVTAAVSRKTHGAAGTFDIDVWAGVSECRTQGVTTLVVTFDQAVAAVDSPIVDVSSGSVSDVQINGSVVTITTSGGVLHGTLTVWFPGLADAATGDCLVTDTVNAQVKLGDVNSSGGVDSSDLLLVRDNLFEPITESNFTADVDASGAIDSTDLLIVRDNLFQ